MFLSLVLAFCIFLPAMFMMVGCGNNQVDTYVWERIWSFQGVVDGDWQGVRSGETGNEMTVESLFRREFDKNNLDLANVQIEDQVVDLTSVKTADELKKAINNVGISYFDRYFEGLKISFSSKEDLKVTISTTSYTTTYTAKEGNNPYFKSYDMVKADESGEQVIGSFGEVRFKIRENECAQLTLNDKSFYVGVYIPTRTIVNDPSMAMDRNEQGEVIRTSLLVGFNAFFTSVKD